MSGRDGHSRGPKKIGDLLEGVLEGRGVGKGVRRAGVVEEWEERVGEGIARVTTARAVSDAVLFVEVRSSPWLAELNMMREEILERINEGREDAPIEKIVFVLAERP